MAFSGSDRTHVCVLGLGYIGLPTAVLLADSGTQVTGVDSCPEVVAAINAGETHIREPDLDARLKSALAGGRLRATDTPPEADVYLIAVPTPLKDGSVPDLTQVDRALDAIIPRLRPGVLVIIESTVAPGVTDGLTSRVLDARPDLSIAEHAKGRIYVAYCPERVLPGRILRELLENDRVIGGVDRASAEVACDFYRSFVRGACHSTTTLTAEVTKLAENAFRDVNIAFANELSRIVRDLDVEIHEVVELANRHPRVDILRPGPGVGGHCIAVDPWFLVHAAPHDASLIRTARAVNEGTPGWVTSEVMKAIRSTEAMHTIVCMGLTYKADVADLRESPAVQVVAGLARAFDGPVVVVDPYVDRIPDELGSLGVALMSTSKALEVGTAFVGLTDHVEFRTLGAQLPIDALVFDPRGMWR